MILYKKVSLEDRDWIQEKIAINNFRGSEYCFVNQFLWGNLVQMEAACVEGCLCTSYPYKPDTAVHDFPVGVKEPKDAIMALIRDNRQKGRTTIIRGIMEEQKLWMEEIFGDDFRFAVNRDDCDYLYPVETLATLSGRKFHGKRNHIARFKEKGEWSFENIVSENIPECRQMYQEWLTLNMDRLDDTITQEKVIVEGCFTHFEELKLQGGILRQEGQAVGFCIGEPLNSDTFIVHIEKAYTQVQGAYPMLNQQFVLTNMENYTYVNREDDMGLEGLRKAKMSYYPEPLLEKYHAFYEK